MPDVQQQLREQVRAALRNARIKQTQAARQLGISEKHLSQMLTGRVQMPLGTADRILGLCGMHLVIALQHTTTPGAPDA